MFIQSLRYAGDLVHILAAHSDYENQLCPGHSSEDRIGKCTD